jgi:hypothetical protein
MPNLFYGARAGVNTSDLGGMRVWKGAAAAPVANWWEAGGAACIWAAYQPKGAANFAASLVDLSGTGNDAIDPGGASTPDWDAVNGWDFDLTVPEYLRTTFIPATDQSQSALVQFTGFNVALTQRLFGSDRSGAQIFATGRTVAVDQYANGSLVSGIGAIGAGNQGVAGTFGYQDGLPVVGPFIASGLAYGRAVWIGGSNNGTGVPLYPSTCYIQKLAIYTCVLTAPQMLAVATAMAT